MTSSRMAIFIHLANGRRTNEIFPQYFQYRYGFNQEKCLNEAFEKKLLRYSNIKENIKFCTITDIKAVLKKYNLSQSGKKDILVERLLENIEEKELKKYFFESRYVLDTDGEKLLEKKSYIPIYDKINSKIHEMDLKKVEDKIKEGKSIFQACIEILKTQIERDRKNNSWDFLKVLYRHIGLIYKEEGKLNKAFKYILISFSLEFTGLSNGTYSEKCYLYPGLVRELRDLQIKLDYSNEDIEKSIGPLIISLNLPMQRFTNKEIAKIIILALEDETEKVEEIIKTNDETLYIFDTGEKINLNLENDEKKYNTPKNSKKSYGIFESIKNFLK